MPREYAGEGPCISPLVVVAPTLGDPLGVRGWIGVLVGVAACSSSTGDELTVDLRTDLEPGRELVGVVTEVFDEEGTLLATDEHLVRPERDDFFVGARVAEFTSLGRRRILIRVATLGSGSFAFLDRLVEVELEGDLAITVLMTRDCRSVFCPEGTACVDGACVDQRCVAESLEGCEPSCADDADCSTALECVQGRCVDGACFDTLEDGLCDEGEICSASVGCVAQSGCSEDAECDDGVLCTTDTCSADGFCLNRPDDDACDDGNMCTDDVCDPAMGCGSVPNAAPCDDGFFCNGEDTCGSGVCSVHAGSPCPTQCNESTMACEACASDSNCGTLSFGDWTSCDYTDVCDESGERMRSVSTPRCTGGSCEIEDGVEMQACDRSTDGETCPAGACNGGTCRPCGDRGEACCPGSSCDSPYMCRSGTCELPGSDMCVDGTLSNCNAIGGTWTGTQCCVDDVSACVGGTFSNCNAIGGLWTGALCCVRDVAQCVDGQFSNCNAVGGRWTGSLCCVTEPLCVAGIFSNCNSIGGSWTGALCCLDEDVQCVAGQFSNCNAIGGSWTGNLCCVDSSLDCSSGTFGACNAAGGDWTGSLCCL